MKDLSVASVCYREIASLDAERSHSAGVLEDEGAGLLQ